ncbi:MAG TPA: TerC family protein [Oxalicibacterium sp.]|nr:TerC family protein [Oxalicibacterium sp.]
MFASLSDPTMWVALLQIIIINVLLSGDNAVIIALACRSLEPKQQRNAFLIGTVAIVILMTALTAFAAVLMTIPYVEMVGAVLLLWIGIKLLLPEEENGDVNSSENFWSAVKTIIIADIVMSLDNVLGMAGAANGHMALLFVGMVITIPLILFGSAMLMKLMERFPIIVTIGAGLLGYVAGEMAVEDPALKGHLANAHYLEIALPILGALIVVIVGKTLAARHAAGAATEG